MTNVELIGTIIYSSIAAVLAVVLVLATLLAAGMLRRNGRLLIPAFFVLLMLGGAVSVAFSSRNSPFPGRFPVSLPRSRLS